MKKSILVALLLIGLIATAQSKDSKERRHRNGMQDFTPEQMATLQTKKMTLALDLNPEQQTRIKAVHLENAKMRKTKMEERKAQKKSEEKTKPTSEERYAMSITRLDAKIAQKAEMKSILSDAQYDKWEKMHNRRGKHGKGKHGKDKNSKGKKKQE